MKFSDKRVFITGANRGIGAAIANAFMEEGAYVIGTRTKRESDVNVACSDWVIADFLEEEQIYSCAENIKAEKIDILINNAGINENASFVEIDDKVFKNIQQVNLFAPYVLCKAALKGMVEKSWGRIVNISSIWGKVSKNGRASYSASKFALDGLTLSIASEYSSKGILANCIAPGFIDTSLTRRMLSEQQIEALTSQVPLERLGTPDEIAELVLWLSSARNTFVTGQNIAIDGGFTRV